ncbi:AAA family ATPase [Methanoculleus sp.]|uniref:AAA family ATPase n=1 Tax=Methanoculleus sp. TaxID=90427 RepID=UPI0025CED651|nr:AAA family ATPase [Methanoculleus sp.]MCK9318167.1 AAA family ATPase [Methanoculleus sp.]
MKQDQPHGAPPLFRDASAFTTHYIPNPGRYRLIQAEELAFELLDGMAGATPRTVICRGPPGTGKTACVRAIFSELETLTSRFVPVYVDCRVDRTRYSILSRISSNLTGRPPAEDMAESEVIDTIADHLLEHRAVLAVCLDNIDHISAGVTNYVLHVLLRMHETWPGVKVGAVAIINSPYFNLCSTPEASNSSVFHPAEIIFPPFSNDEIRGILRDRVQQGLSPGVLSDEIFALVVEGTMECGNIRMGISLLRQAVTIAEQDGRRSVTREDVCTAYKSWCDGFLQAI